MELESLSHAMFTTVIGQPSLQGMLYSLEQWARLESPVCAVFSGMMVEDGASHVYSLHLSNRKD